MRFWDPDAPDDDKTPPDDRLDDARSIRRLIDNSSAVISGEVAVTEVVQRSRGLADLCCGTVLLRHENRHENGKIKSVVKYVTSEFTVTGLFKLGPGGLASS